MIGLRYSILIASVIFNTWDSLLEKIIWNIQQNHQLTEAGNFGPVSFIPILNWTLIQRVCCEVIIGRVTSSILTCELTHNVTPIQLADLRPRGECWQCYVRLVVQSDTNFSVPYTGYKMGTRKCFDTARNLFELGNIVELKEKFNLLISSSLNENNTSIILFWITFSTIVWG